MDANPDPGLQNAVARGDNAPFRVDHSAVQRVRHGADHGRGRAAWQLCVRVESDNVAHRLNGLDVAGLHRKRVENTHQVLVQIKQLAALALPTHPNALPRVEDTEAVKQGEAPAAVGAVLRIQVVDQFHRKVHQRVRIVFARACHGIGQVGDQREVKMRVRIRQVANLQFGDQLAQLFLV